MKLQPLHTLLAILVSTSLLVQAEIPVKSGDKVAFLGDSITAAGNGGPGGYCQLIGSALAANGVKIEIIGAGISGHKSNQMLERLERDVLSKKPQWMTLSCGVNDVWHGDKGVPLEDYKKNITSIVDKAHAAGIKVVILTSTMITEDQANPNNQKLATYNDFLRSLATEKKCLLADLNADMQAALAEATKTQPKPAGKNILTTDGVHMAFPGNVMMAIGVLKGFGLNAAELTKAKEAWLDIPNTNPVKVQASLTQRQAQQLEKVAAARKTNMNDMLNDEFNKLLQSFMKSGGQ
ncbi:MAG: SGNH/GDSL hydrolase family protein [Verrucomicrobia bacterium]|nr:SGNH/GDSL hydrolase family protein [Verrucomicrobiota bacterium]